MDKSTARTDLPTRSLPEALFFQFMIRAKHFLLSWFYLKPLLLKRFSPYPTREGYRNNDISYLSAFLLKIYMLIAALPRQFPWMIKLAYATRLMHLLHIPFPLLEGSLLRQAKKQVKQGKPVTRAVPLPSFDWKNRTPEEFYEEYIKTPHPVVLRGFLKEFVSLEDWGFDRMVEKFGEEEVYLTKPELDGYPGKLKEVNEPNVYLHNSEVLFDRHTEFFEGLNYHKLEPYTRRKKGFAQFFIGRKKTGAPMHCASSWNFFFMLDGQKTWYFVHPNDSAYVYPFYRMGMNATFAHNMYPDDYNKDDYPLMEYCPYYEVTLEPGDLLFNPPWWWHSIRNVSEKTVAVASRWYGGKMPGHNFLMTEEDYEINRFFSLIFQLGMPSFVFMHRILKGVSPYVDGKFTSREKRDGRFIHIQLKMVKDKIFGLKNKF